MGAHDDLLLLLAARAEKGVDLEGTAAEGKALLDHAEQDLLHIQLHADLHVALLTGAVAHVGHDLLQLEAHVGLVDGADIFQLLAQLHRHIADVFGKGIDDIFVLPAAFPDEPGGAGEVVQRHDGRHTVFPAAAEHIAVVGDLPLVIAPFLRLDARLLDGKAVSVEPGVSHKSDIFLIAVVVIHRHTGGLGIIRMLQILHYPEIAVGVVALHLMGGRRRADKKMFIHGSVPPL